VSGYFSQMNSSSPGQVPGGGRTTSCGLGRRLETHVKPVGVGVVWFRKVMMKESKGSEDIVMRRRGTSSHPSATRGRVSKVVGMERVWRCGGVVVWWWWWWLWWWC
jgi:hypothetical protein